MLVITRRPDERTAFPPPGIAVRALKPAKDSARIGIETPPMVPILRGALQTPRIKP